MSGRNGSGIPGGAPGCIEGLRIVWSFWMGEEERGVKWMDGWMDGWIGPYSSSSTYCSDGLDLANQAPS